MCDGVRNEDYGLLVAKGVSTFKCSACAKRHDPESVVLETDTPSNDSAVTNGTPQEMQQEPTSYEQFELRRLVRLLCQKIDTLTTDVRSLKSENESL